MAVQRLTLANIITEILQISGFSTSDDAPWETDAALIRKINMTTQKIPQKVAAIMAAQRKDVEAGRCKLSMWKSSASATASSGSGNLVVSSGSATVELPDDYDHWISFYDTTEEKFFYPIVKTQQERFRRLMRKPNGPPEAIEIQGMGGSNWQRQARLLPAPPSGVTPAFDLDYYRHPAIMPGSDTSGEYPDTDYDFQYLWVLMPLLDILRVDDAAYSRYQEQEKEMLLELAATARAV